MQIRSAQTTLESEKYDQVLDSILVGPVTVGMCRFVLEVPPLFRLHYSLISKANCPDTTKIPPKDAVGITCVLLTGIHSSYCLLFLILDAGSYRKQEFIRVGYFVNNEYESMEQNMNPPREFS
jgi:histone chaperone ASF1